MSTHTQTPPAELYAVLMEFDPGVIALLASVELEQSDELRAAVRAMSPTVLAALCEYGALTEKPARGQYLVDPKMWELVSTAHRICAKVAGWHPGDIQTARRHLANAATR